MASTTHTKPKVKRRKRKAKVKVSTRAKVVRKDSVLADTLPKMKARPPANVAPTFKIKIRRKR